MLLVQFEGVSKRFAELQALTECNLDVQAGEVFGLVGPNGAGKTTALRILCGLLQPDAGTIAIGGHDVRADPLGARKLLAFVPDGAPMYANLSPQQHLELVGRLHGIDEARIRDESLRLLDALDLGPRRHDPVGQFSRGMRQKAALACAILPQPKLLILDEPLNGLDAATTGVFKEVLRGWADRGGAVLYTSHLLDVVERVCDRIAVLDKGRIVANGDLDALRTQAGRGGTLEQVFAALTNSADPKVQAARLLG